MRSASGDLKAKFNQDCAPSTTPVTTAVYTNQANLINLKRTPISDQSIFAQPTQPAATTVNNTSNWDVVLTLRTQVKSRMRGELATDVGDLIVVLHSDQHTPTHVLARNERKGLRGVITDNNFETGLIAKTQLQLDNIHSTNRFLAVLDIVLNHPSLLSQIMRIDECKELPAHYSTVVNLLNARRILPEALMALLEMEFSKKIGLNKSSGDLLRDETCAIKLMSAILKPSANLNKFSLDFIQNMTQYIETETKKRSFKKEKPLARILSFILHHFILLDSKDFPPELILIMQCINETAMKHGVEENQRITFVGTAFFLRYLCPLIRMSEDNDKAFGKSLKKIGLTSKAINKGLISIQNRIDPEENEFNNTTFSPILEELRSLYKPAAKLISRMATLPIKEFAVDYKLEKEAAVYYQLILSILSKDSEANKPWIDAITLQPGEPSIDEQISTAEAFIALACKNNRHSKYTTTYI